MLVHPTGDRHGTASDVDLRPRTDRGIAAARHRTLPGSVRRRSPSLSLSLPASLARRYTVRIAPFPVRWIAGSLQYGAPPSERGGARTETDVNSGGGKGRRPCGASIAQVVLDQQMIEGNTPKQPCV